MVDWWYSPRAAARVVGFFLLAVPLLGSYVALSPEADYHVLPLVVAAGWIALGTVLVAVAPPLRRLTVQLILGISSASLLLAATVIGPYAAGPMMAVLPGNVASWFIAFPRRSAVIACVVMAVGAAAGAVRAEVAPELILSSLTAASAVGLTLWWLVSVARTAEIDPLTALPNRRQLDWVLQALQQPAAIAVIDLDDFKAINDRVGHPGGDLLLQAVAETLHEVSGPSWSVFRTGGDEFVVVAPRMSATRLRQRLTGLGGTGPTSWSASVGVASTSDYASAQQAIEAADSALYAVKHRRG
ncbi:MAG: GGDEF domain-containing protein [Nocardioides sp.]|uniref:GGDEF domain-containing protein n=1 Tax=Nocardioides sp. TaxID=35761 RepID=UPI0039E2B0C1